MFRDRKDAGCRLADALAGYRDQNPLVLAIPRGGIEIGYHVARRLEAELSPLVVRKLPSPDNPEAGFGAVAEDGSLFIVERVAAVLQAAVVQEIIEQQKREIERRIRVLRGGRPLPPVKGRTVIIVDDGIAMGSTIKAGITLCLRRQAGQIIVAVPVAGRETARELSTSVDEVIVLEQPSFFRAVAQVYENWYDVSDREAMDLLERHDRQRAQHA